MRINILQTIGTLLFLVFAATFIVGLKFSRGFPRENLDDNQIKGQTILAVSLIILALSIAFIEIPKLFY